MFLTLIAALLLSLVQVMKGQINLVVKGHLFMKSNCDNQRNSEIDYRKIHLFMPSRLRRYSIVF
jgi:hypothetical protein